LNDVLALALDAFGHLVFQLNGREFLAFKFAFSDVLAQLILSFTDVFAFILWVAIKNVQGNVSKFL